jgi:anti-sigma regulatory factor (Ser/Thr protein kinase)
VSTGAEPASVDLEIPPGSAYVAVVRLVIAALARGAGLEEEAVEELKIALSEACTNAVLVHEEASLDEPVSVRWIEEPERVLVEVADRGPAPDASDPANEFDSQGFSSRMVMSRVLLEALIDGCEFVPRSGGGTITRLVVSRETQPG